MADIFRARATTEGGVERHVVLKRVLAKRSRDSLFAKMFLDEARLASQLQHPNIAQVYDIGKLAGSYFFTMEYVHGEDVRALLQRLSILHRQIPPNLALYIASGALAALHHAHEKTSSDGRRLGVVHRDVSPANVMIGYEGCSLAFATPKSSSFTGLVRIPGACRTEDRRNGAGDDPQMFARLVAADRPTSAPGSNARHVRIERAGIVNIGGSTVDLTRRLPLHRIIIALAERRISAKGEAIPLGALVDVGWPAEKIRPDAAVNRVHVALSSLRRVASACARSLSAASTGT